MCSGKTHDSITYLTAPLVGGLCFAVTNDIDQTLLFTGSFLFSGLMFGPDLDCKSIQVKRWGQLKWIWKPYQHLIPCHRHPLSHGFLLGTIVRLLYMSPVVYLVCVSFEIPFSWTIASLIFWGLETGAMSHSIADQLCTNYKKLTKRGDK